MIKLYVDVAYFSDMLGWTLWGLGFTEYEAQAWQSSSLGLSK